MRVPFVAFLVSLALLAGGCAGDDDAASVAEWADAFCGATHDWGEEIDRIGDDVSNLGSITPETIQEASRDVREATDQYLDAVQDLGGPPTDSGESVEAAIDELADEIDEESAEIEDAVDDATGVAAGATAGREIAASLVAMFSALEQTLDTLRAAETDEELEAALAESAACDEIL